MCLSASGSPCAPFRHAGRSVQYEHQVDVADCDEFFDVFTTWPTEECSATSGLAIAKPGRCGRKCDPRSVAGSNDLEFVWTDDSRRLGKESAWRCPDRDRVCLERFALSRTVDHWREYFAATSTGANWVWQLS